MQYVVSVCCFFLTLKLSCLFTEAVLACLRLEEGDLFKILPFNSVSDKELSC